MGILARANLKKSTPWQIIKIRIYYNILNDTDLFGNSANMDEIGNLTGFWTFFCQQIAR